MPVKCDQKKLRRIGEAMSEGCNGRSYASGDAKWLAREYERQKIADPAAGFGECNIRARMEFIELVLGDRLEEQS